MYEYEITALVRAREGGRKVRKLKAKFSKPKDRWSMTDYDILERYLGRREDVQGDVSIIEVEEIK